MHASGDGTYLAIADGRSDHRRTNHRRAQPHAEPNALPIRLAVAKPTPVDESG